MSRRNTSLIRTALKVLDASGANRLAATLNNSVGAILMLHNVAPETGEAFEPNRILRITPGFLEDLINLVHEMGYEAISLDELPSHIAAGSDARPFVAFTFDDGYRDNRDYALPIFRRHNIPMAVYIPSEFADGNGDLWWLRLEKCIRELSAIDFTIADRSFKLDSSTTEAKYSAFHEIYWYLRSVPEPEARDAITALCDAACLDTSTLCRDLVMNWDELREFAADPLVTIGAHTTGHYALAKLDPATAKLQMRENIERIETELNLPCRHFSFPYGSEIACGEREFNFARQLGMMTAVTTEKGLIHKHHRRTMTALPRVSVNGDYQDLRLMRTLLSGAPFALLDGYRQLARIPHAARALISPRPLATST